MNVVEVVVTRVKDHPVVLYQNHFQDLLIRGCGREVPPSFLQFVELDGLVFVRHCLGSVDFRFGRSLPVDPNPFFPNLRLSR